MGSKVWTQPGPPVYRDWMAFNHNFTCYTYLFAFLNFYSFKRFKRKRKNIYLSEIIFYKMTALSYLTNHYLSELTSICVNSPLFV